VALEARAAGWNHLDDIPPRLSASVAALRAAANAEPGCTEREALYSEDKLTLYRYRPLAATTDTSVDRPPLLIVYALVNRPTMLDLQPDRSLIRRLLERGLDIYLIDWGYPNGADRFLDLNDYINGYLARCVRHVLQHRHVSALNLLGVCQGGSFSLCYTALHPATVRNLVTMVTPVDFHTEGNLLSRWVRDLDIDALVEANGLVSGDLLNAAYLALMPFRLLQQKYLHLLDAGGDPAQIENFVRMEKWIFDSPAQAGEAFRQFARCFFQENQLCQGRLQIGGRAVNLKAIRAPILNVYGKLDHLVPPAASKALAGLTASRDYSELALEVGHIGMYVSSRSQTQLPQAIADWLKARP
jgi:polyhydroxyalkanoate synthase